MLVVTDYFSKWVEIFGVADQTAVTCARVILNEVVARFGCPLSIHSDQGRNYESHIFTELCRMLEVRKTRTSPGNPRCNGQTERFNRTLMRMVKAFLKDEQRDWDLHLGCLAAAYRASPHEATGMTPNLLMLGREVRLPAEIIFGSGTTLADTPVASYGEYVTQLRSRMQHAHQVARKHLDVSAKRQKQNYDVRSKDINFQAGDLVWYQSEIGQLNITPKLRKPFMGPCVVLERVNDINYRIQLDKKGGSKLVNVCKLKKYVTNGETLASWVNTAAGRARGRIKVRRTLDMRSLLSFRSMAPYPAVERRGLAMECLRCEHPRYRGDKAQLEVHVITSHLSLSEVPFYCGECQRRYMTSRRLDNHVNEKHPGATGEIRGGTQIPFLLSSNDFVALDAEASERHYNRHGKKEVTATATSQSTPRDEDLEELLQRDPDVLRRMTQLAASKKRQKEELETPPGKRKQSTKRSPERPSSSAARDTSPAGPSPSSAARDTSPAGPSRVTDAPKSKGVIRRKKKSKEVKPVTPAREPSPELVVHAPQYSMASLFGVDSDPEPASSSVADLLHEKPLEPAISPLSESGDEILRGRRRSRWSSEANESTEPGTRASSQDSSVAPPTATPAPESVVSELRSLSSAAAKAVDMMVPRFTAQMTAMTGLLDEMRRTQQSMALFLAQQAKTFAELSGCNARQQAVEQHHQQRERAAEGLAGDRPDYRPPQTQESTDRADRYPAPAREDADRQHDYQPRAREDTRADSQQRQECHRQRTAEDIDTDRLEIADGRQPRQGPANRYQRNRWNDRKGQRR